MPSGDETITSQRYISLNPGRRKEWIMLKRAKDTRFRSLPGTIRLVALPLFDPEHPARPEIAENSGDVLQDHRDTGE